MAALRHLLRPLKQISSLGYARAGTPRPVLSSPAFGLRPRTFTSGTNNKAQAKTYTTAAQDLEARLSPGFGMRYYRHGKMVMSASDDIPGLMDDRTFRLLILGIDVFFIGLPTSLGIYYLITE